jgi:integrase
MQFTKERPATGHVFQIKRKKGPVWVAKYRLPDGRQVKKTIGLAHTGRGRPPAGTYSRRTAEDWLRDVLQQAEAKTLPGTACPGVTFEQAAREWLRFVAEERACKPSTVRSYRSSVEARLIPAFGEWRLEDITARDLERWRATLLTSPRTKNKLLTELYGIFKRAQKVYGLPRNPAAEVDKLRERRRIDLEVLSPEEIHALCRAATSQQDAAIFLTAAFTGLRRGELIALRWRDVDFTASRVRVVCSVSAGQLSTPKNDKTRSVPMAREVAGALAQLGQRGRFTGDDDLVFPGTFRRPPRRRRAQPAVRQGARAGGSATPPLPRPAAHLRDRDDREGRHRPRPGVDGSRRHPDHPPLPALPPAPR